MKSYSAENSFLNLQRKENNFEFSDSLCITIVIQRWKGKGKTEIEIDTRGGEVKKLIVHDEFNIDEQENDDLKLAIQTK